MEQDAHSTFHWPQSDMDNQSKPRPNSSSHWFALLFTLFFLALYTVFDSSRSSRPVEISYSEFKQAVDGGRVRQVTLSPDRVSGEWSAGQNGRFRAVLPPWQDPQLLPLLEQKGVTIKGQSSENPFWLRAVIAVLPWLLLFVFFLYSSRMMAQRMGGSGLFDFSRSRAHRYDKSRIRVKFDEVAGVDAAKQDLLEVIDYLKHPQKYTRIGARMPHGILMMGPPGSGKTLLAKATAGEAEVPFFSVSGSEFIEMFVGVGASRVRDMFRQARAEAPALIFIDEIDSIGRVRGTGLGGGNDEREQTLNQILSEMDGFEPEEAVVVLAATNRPDVLDPALLRPGRFDRKITLDLPHSAARLKILQVHTRKTPLASDVDLEQIAARTVGFSGADLQNLVNEAALNAARLDREQLTAADFDEARDKVMLGSMREELLNEHDRERIAYHEAGHALTAVHVEHADPLTRISIIPRGRALGLTEQLPEEERHHFTEDYFSDRLAILLGGRGAERLVFGVVSSGAADDLKQATRLARKMVAEWGMSELGPLSLPLSEEHPFLGRDIAQPRDFSEASLARIDQEVERLLHTAEMRTEAILQGHRAQLDLLAKALLKQELLNQGEIAAILAAAPR
jgi:cell division protease FtsH